MSHIPVKMEDGKGRESNLGLGGRQDGPYRAISVSRITGTLSGTSWEYYIAYILLPLFRLLPLVASANVIPQIVRTTHTLRYNVLHLKSYEYIHGGKSGSTFPLYR